MEIQKLSFKTACEILGRMFEEKYKNLGFNYKKSTNSVTKKTERYTHNIYFIGFSGNTKDNIRVDVRFVINKASYDYTDVGQKKWLNIANEEHINESFTIIYQQF